MTTGSLGARWGCGHSLGLLIMTAVFFAAGQTVDLDVVGAYLNYVVGVFMIVLGAWTGVDVRRKYLRKLVESECEGQPLTPSDIKSSASTAEFTTATGSTKVLATYSMLDIGSVDLAAITADSTVNSPPPPPFTCDAERGGNQQEECPLMTSTSATERTQSFSLRLCSSSSHRKYWSTGSQAHLAPLSPAKVTMEATRSPVSSFHLFTRHHDAHQQENRLDLEVGKPSKMKRGWCSNVSFGIPWVQKVTALAVGIVHDIAGPGGTLGVLPAVVLNNWLRSTVYLGSFCIASIGGFAALSVRRNRPTRGQLRVGLVSASFSIVVGIAWILFQATGVMELVFDEQLAVNRDPLPSSGFNTRVSTVDADYLMSCQ